MIGSIIGDIVGSIYEFDNIKTKEFELVGRRCTYTDDSILSIATADWLLHGGEVAQYYSRYALANPCPMGGYGGGFLAWVGRTRHGDFEPYNSCGNGSAMRVGPVGWAYDDMDQALEAAAVSAGCTHNHPEGVKGAQATVCAIVLARQGADKATIRREIIARFGYDLGFTCDGIRDSYEWGALCQSTVPQAIVAFLDGTSFEDSLRNAISIGGDSDTLGCITGSIAEAFYGVPAELRELALERLSTDLRKVVVEFETKHNQSIVNHNFKSLEK